MKQEKDLLKPADVAPLLGVSRARVYQLLAEGVVPSLRVGNALRIPRPAYERWLAQQSQKALKRVKRRPQEARADASA